VVAGPARKVGNIAKRRENQVKINTKKLGAFAALSVIAYIAIFCRVPARWILNYDPRNIIITIGGFLYGPLAALAMTVAVSLTEMLTVKDSSWFDLLMNIISGGVFACTAAFIYKKHRRLAGAGWGLVAAWLLTTAVMMVCNYLILPIYMLEFNLDATVQELREQIVSTRLLMVFLPFNLFKGALDAALIMLLYKPVKSALQMTRLTPPPGKQDKKYQFRLGLLLIAVFIIVVCVFWWLQLRKII